MPDHELVLLAALIADGNLTQRTPRFCFGHGSPRPARGRARRRGDSGSACPRAMAAPRASAPARRAVEPADRVVQRHGIWGRRSARQVRARRGLRRSPTSRSPASSGSCTRCDGHVYATDRFSQIGYTTISERLARDVQHLLLRLGIVASIRTLRRAVYEGTDTVAREVRITSREGLDALRAHRFRSSASRTASAASPRSARRGGRRPTSTRCPSRCGSESLEAKGDRSWADVSAAAGHPRNHNWHVGTRGVSRPQLATLAAATGSPVLQRARRLRSLVGRGRVDRAAGRSGDLRPHGPGRPQLRRRRHRRPQQRPDGQLRRERGARVQEGRRAVLARDVGVRARAALHRLAGVDQGRRPAQGQGPPSRWPKILQASNRARRVAAVHRRLVRPLGARRPRQGAPAGAAERGRARADPDRLPAADARERQRREPRRADRPDLARAQDARARARRPGDRAVAAQPRRRAADGQAARALRPS